MRRRRERFRSGSVRGQEAWPIKQARRRKRSDARLHQIQAATERGSESDQGYLRHDRGSQRDRDHDCLGRRGTRGATSEIARNVQQTAASAREVTTSISGVSQAASETGARPARCSVRPAISPSRRSSLPRRSTPLCRACAQRKDHPAGGLTKGLGPQDDPLWVGVARHDARRLTERVYAVQVLHPGLRQTMQRAHRPVAARCSGMMAPGRRPGHAPCRSRRDDVAVRVLRGHQDMAVVPPGDAFGASRRSSSRRVIRYSTPHISQSGSGQMFAGAALPFGRPSRLKRSR